MNKAYTQQQLIRTVEDFMARRGQDLSGEEILKDGDRQYMIRMVNTTVVMNIDEQDVSLWCLLGEFEEEDEPDMYRRFLEVSLDIPEFSLCIMGDRLVCAKSMEVRHLDDGYVLDLLYLADAIPSMVLSRLFR